MKRALTPLKRRALFERKTAQKGNPGVCGVAGFGQHNKSPLTSSMTTISKQRHFPVFESSAFTLIHQIKSLTSFVFLELHKQAAPLSFVCHSID